MSCLIETVSHMAFSGFYATSFHLEKKIKNRVNLTLN